MFRIHSFEKRSALLTLLLSAGLASAAAAQQQAPVKIQIIADGMCCQGCAQKIAAQLYAAPGVSNVEADVASHTVVVTFKPSPKLTLAGLWHATEKADGKPSKLVTSQATYLLQRPEQLKLSQPLAPGRYWVVVGNLTSTNEVQNISRQLSAVRGVKSVDFDAANRTFFVQTANTDFLSPWSLLVAVDQSGHNTSSVTGPHGLFMVERAVERAAQANQFQQQQGGVR